MSFGSCQSPMRYRQRPGTCQLVSMLSLLFSLLLFASQVSAGAGPFSAVIQSDKDTLVNLLDPSRNYGSMSSVVITSSPYVEARSFFGFSLNFTYTSNGVTTTCQNCCMQKAIMVLDLARSIQSQFTTTDPFTWYFYPVQYSKWSQSTLTWSSASTAAINPSSPANSAISGETSLGGSLRQGVSFYYRIPLQAVSDAIASYNRQLSFRLRMGEVNSDIDYVYFASSRSSVPPLLSYTFADCDDNAACTMTTNFTALCQCLAGYSGNGYNCQRRSCDSVVEVNATWPSASSGSDVLGTCLPGFEGGPIRSCGLNGSYGTTFTGTPCVPSKNVCPQVTEGNASFNATNIGTTNITVNGTCLIGYIGNLTRQCLTTGSWGAIQGSCKANFKGCPDAREADPETKKNAVIFTRSEPNTTATGECLSGFEPISTTDLPTRFCFLDGSWGPTKNLCRRMGLFCESETIDGALYPRTMLGSLAIGNCTGNMVGNPIRQCDNNGNWSTEVKQPCVSSSSSNLDVVGNETLAKNQSDTSVTGSGNPGAILGAYIGSTIAAVLIAAGATFYLVRRHQQKRLGKPKERDAGESSSSKSELVPTGISYTDPPRPPVIIRPPLMNLQRKPSDVAPPPILSQKPQLTRLPAALSGRAGNEKRVRLTMTDATLMNTVMEVSLPAFLEVEPTHYRKLMSISEGTAGVLWKAEVIDLELRKRASSSLVAVKELTFSSKRPWEDMQNLFYQEVAMMWSCIHPNIIPVYGYITKPEQKLCAVITKLYPTDLAKLIADPSVQLGWRHILKLASDIALAMSHIHAIGILHRDLKSRNILIDDRHADSSNSSFPRAMNRDIGASKRTTSAIGLLSSNSSFRISNDSIEESKLDGEDRFSAVVCDFGISKVVGGPTVAGQKFVDLNGFTPRYAAPEVFARSYLKNVAVNPEEEKKCDVYAFAIVLWELLTRKTPWENMTREGIEKAVRSGQRPPEPNNPSFGYKKLVELMRDCWVEDPMSRPSFEQILNRLKHI